MTTKNDLHSKHTYYGEVKYVYTLEESNYISSLSKAAADKDKPDMRSKPRPGYARSPACVD